MIFHEKIMKIIKNHEKIMKIMKIMKNQKMSQTQNFPKTSQIDSRSSPWSQNHPRASQTRYTTSGHAKTQKTRGEPSPQSWGVITTKMTYFPKIQVITSKMIFL